MKFNVCGARTDFCQMANGRWGHGGSFLQGALFVHQSGHSAQCFIYGNICEQVLCVKTNVLFNKVLWVFYVAGGWPCKWREEDMGQLLGECIRWKPIHGTIGWHGTLSLSIFGRLHNDGNKTGASTGYNLYRQSWRLHTNQAKISLLQVRYRSYWQFDLLKRRMSGICWKNYIRKFQFNTEKISSLACDLTIYKAPDLISTNKINSINLL